MENRAAAAHAETSKTWTRLLDQGAHRLTEVGQLKAPVDYAQAGATTPAPSRKTRRQDMPGTETNGGVDRCLLRGTPGHCAGKSRPTSVASAAFTVTSPTHRSAALMPSRRKIGRASGTHRACPPVPTPPAALPPKHKPPP